MNKIKVTEQIKLAEKEIEKLLEIEDKPQIPKLIDDPLMKAHNLNAVAKLLLCLKPEVIKHSLWKEFKFDKCDFEIALRQLKSKNLIRKHEHYDYKWC